MTPRKHQSVEESQRERFEQAARELGVKLDEEKLKEALRKIAPHPEGKDPSPQSEVV